MTTANQGTLLESCPVWPPGTVAVLVLGPDSLRQFTAQCALREVICTALRAVPEGVSRQIGAADQAPLAHDHREDRAAAPDPAAGTAQRPRAVRQHAGRPGRG